MLKDLVQENVSVEAYLLQEEKATVRHEFVNGKLFEMSGGTRFHEKIITNIIVLLSNLLRGKNYEVYAQGLRCSPNPDCYYYPDVLVTNEIFSDIRFSKHPILLTEVLSPTTRSYDAVDKFIAYRAMSSVEYYLLVEPDYYLVTLYYKTPEGEWMAEIFNKKTDIIDFPKLDIKLPLEEIYYGLEIG